MPFSIKQDGEQIACPCIECVLIHQVNRATTYDHLVINGIMPSYATWFCHGEFLKGSKDESELLHVKQLMRKYISNESMPQNINGTSSEQVSDTNSGHERVAQISRIPSVAENTSLSHGHTV